MNKVSLSIIVGLASAGVGAVAGYFVAMKMLDDKYSAMYEEKLNEELSRIRKAHKEADKWKDTDSVSVSRKDLNDLGVVVSDDRPVEMGGVEYHKIVPEDAAPEEDPDEEVEIDEDGDPIDPSEVADEYWMDTPDFWEDKPPTIISLDEYSDLPPLYENVTYHYYDEDDVLLDDGNQIIDDVTHVVGEALTKFGPEAAALANGDEDAVYVINGRMMLAIEIVRLHLSYESYMGLI